MFASAWSRRAWCYRKDRRKTSPRSSPSRIGAGEKSSSAPRSNSLTEATARPPRLLEGVEWARSPPHHRRNAIRALSIQPEPCSAQAKTHQVAGERENCPFFLRELGKLAGRSRHECFPSTLQPRTDAGERHLQAGHGRRDGPRIRRQVRYLAHLGSVRVREHQGDVFSERDHG